MPTHRPLRQDPEIRTADPPECEPLDEIVVSDLLATDVSRDDERDDVAA
jgi:hypothetical protein